MTIEAIKAATQSTYSVMQYKRKGALHSYITKIGYNKNAKGERVVAWQYHGLDYPKALKAALDWGAAWEAIVKEYKKRKALHDHWIKQAVASALSDGYYLDEQDNKVEVNGDLPPLPEIVKDHNGKPITGAALERYRKSYEAKRKDPALAAYRAILEQSAPELPIWPTDDKEPETFTLTQSTEARTIAPKVNGITIGQAKEKYLADYRKRVGLQSEAGLKARSADQHETTLKIALKAVDEAAPLNTLDTERIEAVAHYWGSPERELSPRTASNYTQAFWQFLLRLPDLKVGFVLPNVDRRLFKFTKVKGKVEKYDKVQLKTLLNALDDQCKLYQLLALQCGFYQVDLWNLKLDEIVTIGDDTFIVRHRDKTSHQGGADFASQWWLFPETVALLKKCVAKKNPKGLALLRPDLTPMGRVGNSDDWVTVRFNKARDAVKETVFTFKQFRKIGYTAIKKLTLSTEVARMYAAKVVTDKEYDRDDAFEPLTAALKKWHVQLKADKVL